MPNEIKINDTHLILLKRNSHDESVSIDYLPIINPMGDLLDGVYKKCEDKITHKDYAEEILNSDAKLRSMFLIEYDFCVELHEAWQDLEDLSDYHFDYDDDLTDQKIKEEVSRNKEWLMCELEYRDLAYALELAYEKAEDKKSIISMSHR